VSRTSGSRRQDFCTLYFQRQVRANTVPRAKSCRCREVCTYAYYNYRYTVPKLPRQRVFPYGRVITCLMEILILTRTLQRKKKKKYSSAFFFQFETTVPRINSPSTDYSKLEILKRVSRPHGRQHRHSIFRRHSLSYAFLISEILF